MRNNEKKKTNAMPVLKAQYVSISPNHRDLLNDYLEAELIEREENKLPRQEMHPLQARTLAQMIEAFNERNHLLEVLKDLKMSEVFMRRLLKNQADPDYGNCPGTLADMYTLVHGILRNGLFIKGVAE